MEWCVVKTGAEMFDALHAYGLGILVASVTSSPVMLQDQGFVYILHSSINAIPCTDTAILN